MKTFLLKPASLAVRVMILFWLFGPFFKLFGQTFIKVDDPTNPAATVVTDANYSGAAWIDYDNDGYLDLHASKTFLFRNTGNGNFESVNTRLGEGIQTGTLSNGVSWGDFDNDGDIDCHIAGSPSILYVNDGGGIFTPVLSGDISPEIENRGWTSAWGDYNNDGYLDLIITHPAGFLGTSLPSHFYENNGDDTFTKLTNFPFTTEHAAYTVATWYDYDLDGDLDLFIGSGPISSTASDYLYKNTFIENGTPGFERITDQSIGMDLQNGQVWNFIDYDNDQDLDAFVTNYDGTINRFYQNNDGNFVEINTALSIDGSHLGSTWGDLDNDGDLDVIITHESGTLYFRNDNGTFVNVSTGFTLSGSVRAAVLGDYDNDGDLDLFVSGSGNARGLFRNDTENSNNWINISLSGTVSNRSAIGATVKVKSTINGNAVWQMRQITAQNTFNGHSSLRVHFGLGDAASIDSVIVKWPSGNEEIFTNISVNQHLQIEEEMPAQFLSPNFSTADRFGFGTLEVEFEDRSLFDSNNPITAWEWDFNNDGVVDDNSQNPVYTYQDTGVYSVRLTISNGISQQTKLKKDYIKIIRSPGIPIVEYFWPAADTSIPKNGQVPFSVSAVDTSGYQISYQWFRNGSPVSNNSTYNYVSLNFQPERTDTIKLIISNGYNETEVVRLVHVSATTDISEDSMFPSEYSLKQNYPNPFNPSTTIEYSVPKASQVSLKIFNLLGTEIAELVNEVKQPGFYSVNADFSKFKNGLSSGIYFYQLKSGNFLSTQKMILIK
jgi:enediyne biosynthesis protein E4